MDVPSCCWSASPSSAPQDDVRKVHCKMHNSASISPPGDRASRKRRDRSKFYMFQLMVTSSSAVADLERRGHCSRPMV